MATARGGKVKNPQLLWMTCCSVFVMDCSDGQWFWWRCENTFSSFPSRQGCKFHECRSFAYFDHCGTHHSEQSTQYMVGFINLIHQWGDFTSQIQLSAGPVLAAGLCTFVLFCLMRAVWKKYRNSNQFHSDVLGKQTRISAESLHQKLWLEKETQPGQVLWHSTVACNVSILYGGSYIFWLRHLRSCSMLMA